MSDDEIGAVRPLERPPSAAVALAHSSQDSRVRILCLDGRHSGKIVLQPAFDGKRAPGEGGLGVAPLPFGNDTGHGRNSFHARRRYRNARFGHDAFER